MKESLTLYEARMRQSLLRALRTQHLAVTETYHIITKRWVIGRAKHEVTILEGRLKQGVYSGDIEISFRRFNVAL